MTKTIKTAQDIATEEQAANTAAIAEDAAQAQELPAVTLDELEGMDMDAFGQQDGDSYPAWRITDDGCADWAIRKIAAEKAELQRLKNIADAQIIMIEEKMAAAERRFQHGTNFFTARLADYFRHVPHKATKTTEKYRLLSGTLTMKLGGQQMKQDDDALMEYLKSSGNEDMIQTVEKPKWGEFKKRLEIKDNKVVDTTTGEIVEGVLIVEKPDVFTIDL